MIAKQRRTISEIQQRGIGKILREGGWFKEGLSCADHVSSVYDQPGSRKIIWDHVKGCWDPCPLAPTGDDELGPCDDGEWEWGGVCGGVTPAMEPIIRSRALLQ